MVIAVYGTIIHYGVFVGNSVYTWYNTYRSKGSDANQDESRSTSHDAANAVCAGSGDRQAGRAHGGRPRDAQERWGPIYAVPSRSEANRWHLVVVDGLHLVCDCVAGQYGRYCAHRAAVRARLELEASVRRDAREREVERAFHAAARKLARATLTSSGSGSDEAMRWWMHGGDWDRTGGGAA